MMKSQFTAALALFITGSIFAAPGAVATMYSIMQPPVSSHNSIFIPERIAREASQQAAKDLGLSEAQKEEYYQLQLRAMEQMESLSKPGKKPTPEESKAHAEAIEAQRLSFEEELKEILTDSQYEKWKRLRQKNNNQSGSLQLDRIQ